MSKRYRKKHRRVVSTVPEKTNRSAQMGVLLSMAGRELGLDGHSNAAAFLGDDSPLLSAGTFARNTLTSNPELLATVFTVGLNVETALLTAVNAVIVALAAMGTYEITFAKVE